MAIQKTHCVDVFLACCAAARNGLLIHRASRQDKEFHFQNWFKDRMAALKYPYDDPRRNAYPDFRLVEIPEGYEIKGLAYPGREATYDSNSQVPTGFHNGMHIYYLFGRYPKDAEDDDYPVIDLVMCDGDFLNADHSYVHKNRSIKGFGSYGDIMIRDRKMYVAPTPFALTNGTTGQQTLIVPRDFPADQRVRAVGRLTRVETGKLVVGYRFDLKKNSIEAQLVDNPGAGKEHEFIAYRAKEAKGSNVTLKPVAVEVSEADEDADSAV